MNSKKYIFAVLALAMVAGLATVATTSAQTVTGSLMGRYRMMESGISGTVSAINGTTLTVFNSRINATYSVNASSAKVVKYGATSSLSAISVGDSVLVQGTVNGTSVTALTIRDNVGMGITGTVNSINGSTLSVTSKAKKGATTGTVYTINASGASVIKNGTTSSLSQIAVNDIISIQGTISGNTITAVTIRDNSFVNLKGNGQPVIAGKVTAISGSTLTVANNNVSYSVDASNANIQKAGVGSASILNISTGDSVIVQGTVSGTSVIASSVIDQNKPASASTNAPRRGFFGGIFSFFQHIFGF